MALWEPVYDDRRYDNHQALKDGVVEFTASDRFEPERGIKQYVDLRVGVLPNGYPVHLPIMAVSGRVPGPTLFVSACLHGDEILGPDVVRRTVQGLEPDDLRGNLITIPVANPLGMASRTRRNRIEMYPGPHDMNRVFPGSADGVLTERTAHLIGEQFIRRADFVFDLHSASVGGRWEPYAKVPRRVEGIDRQVFEASEQLARAFGTPTLMVGSMFHGALVDFAVSAGIPASMAEFGVANVITPADREFGMRGLSNLLRHLEMVEGEVETPGSQLEMTAVHRIRTDAGGFLVLKVDIGQEVAADDEIATVESLSGEAMALFRAPVDGRVCRVNTMGLVGTGDIVAYVAETR